MAKSKVQSQNENNFITFFKDYETEDQCISAVFDWKWPNGFVCPECSSQSYCSLKSRRVYQCNHCHHQTTLASNTIFEQSKLPITTWFLAIHLIMKASIKISAMSLMKLLDVSYNTAWMMRKKIVQAMKEHEVKITGVNGSKGGAKCPANKTALMKIVITPPIPLNFLKMISKNDWV